MPSELTNVAQATVDRLEERLDKCYTQEDYKKFQEDVNSIVLSALGSDDGREKIKVQSKIAAKEYIEEEGWKQRTFWLPLVFSIIAAFAAVGTLFI